MYMYIHIYCTCSSKMSTTVLSCWCLASCDLGIIQKTLWGFSSSNTLETQILTMYMYMYVV